MNNRNIGAKPLRTPGNVLLEKSFMIFAVALILSPLASAQQSSEEAATVDIPEEQDGNGEATEPGEPRKDYYRAEFVILERKTAPENINERMASRIPEPPSPDIEEILRAVNRDGSSETTLELVSRSDLHLNSAANRLENSGRYRVLLATGWYQSFPPDFEGEPLRVAIGDWLEEAGHREVEGHITIDRQRYLHVGVQLNHWLPGSVESHSPSPDALAPGEGKEDNIQPIEGDGDSLPAGGDAAPLDEDTESAVAALADTGDVTEGNQTLISGANWPRAELLTWIRETRRMRSEEVHFLDSPTIGVLVFFKKIEE
ncbi:CsiV family protein [Marinobacter sp. HL-58]|uniref:CsiV family protein n=1 Tax=Marinobacter sp. HL-58 TaxID=1479237 RepID=UPI0005606C1C|nr:CsiV family protein [Marinobacter sp. HL-58]KPQ02504.1 MAG: protein of unknown function DUF2803 [Marinobacter sp. HL-58]